LIAFSFGSIFGFLLFLGILWFLVFLLEKIFSKKERIIDDERDSKFGFI